MMRTLLHSTVGAVLALACALAPAAAGQRRTQARPGPAPGEEWVEQTLRAMTLDEKVGQLLVPATSGTFRSRESAEFQRIRRDITEFHVGGYHVFGGDPAGAALLTNDMQRLAKLPLLITADLEGGPGYVFPGTTRLPRAMALGAAGSEELAYQAGRITALEGRALGIHVNFYPVVDVNNNPRNPIINIRSFGEDVSKVSALARAYIRGAQESGQIATAKHFPGHGDVASDSHLELPVLDIDPQRLRAVELPPFRAAVEQGVGAVMSAHIYLPRVESEKGLPATLSRTVMTGILRDELKFGGLVYTDAMDMRGVSAHFPPDEATVRAIEAGSDVVLFPVNTEVSFKALKAAVGSGRLTVARVEESVRRILRAKARLGLERGRFADVTRLSEAVGTREHRELAQKMMDAAVTLVRDDRKSLPLRPSAETRLLHINLLDSRAGWREAESTTGRTFNAELLKRFPRAAVVQVDDRTSPAEFELIGRMAGMADAVTVNGYIRVGDSKGSIDLSTEQLRLLRHLSGLRKPFVFTLLGSPYLLHAVPELPSYVLTYETHPAAELAALRAITGEIEFRGRLPVSLPGFHDLGHRAGP